MSDHERYPLNMTYAIEEGVAVIYDQYNRALLSFRPVVGSESWLKYVPVERHLEAIISNCVQIHLPQDNKFMNERQR